MTRAMNAAVNERPEADLAPISLHNAEETADKTDLALDPAVITPPRRKVWPLLLAAAVVACGIGAWYAYTHLGAAGQAKDAAKAAGENGRRDNGKATLGFTAESDPAHGGTAAGMKQVATVRAEKIPRHDVLRLTGTLAADERSSVASNTSGIVAEVLVDRGSRVRKGDVLVQLDPTDAKNKLAEGLAMLDELKARLGLDGNVENFNPEDQPEVRLAKASADLAAANLRRAQELVGKKVVSEENFEQTKTEYELAHQRYRQALLLIKQAYAACRTAMAKLAILEKAVADTTIRAPMDGWVAEKLVAVGEQISSGRSRPR